MRYWIPLIMLLITVAAGCSSIKTTAYDRLEDDTLIANPDKHLKGIPVSLRVPSHIELTVREKTFWTVEDTEMIPLKNCRATRTIDHDVKYTEKVFLVDPVRPAGGPLSTDANNVSNYYGFSFQHDDLDTADREAGKEKEYQESGRGYLAGLNYKSNDQTIKRSAELLVSSLSMIKAFSPPAVKVSAIGGGNNPDLDLEIIETTRVIAFSRFDLNSEHFEDDVMNFLDTYVNKKSCDPDCPRTVTCR